MNENDEREMNHSHETEHLRKEIVCFFACSQDSSVFLPSKNFHTKINYWISPWWMKIKLWVLRAPPCTTRRCYGEIIRSRQGNQIPFFAFFVSRQCRLFVVRTKLMSLSGFVVFCNRFRGKKRNKKRINYKHPGHNFEVFFHRCFTFLRFFDRQRQSSNLLSSQRRFKCQRKQKRRENHWETP